jgi:FG-GAP-like repeat
MNLFCRVVRVPVVAAILSLTVGGFAQSFQQTTYSSPNGPTDLFIADLNHDGKPDIVTTQSLSDAVTIFINHGNGKFTSGGSATYLTGRGPQRVVVADFNGDGKPDIATANCNTATHTASISILLGHGDGTFQNHNDIALPAGACPNSLGLIRVAKDTTLSLVVANDGANDVVIARNNGSGSFKLEQVVTSTPPGTTFRGVSAADYNGDGFQDIAVIRTAPGQADEVVTYNGSAAGTFTGPNPVQPTAGLHLIATNTVDFDGSGKADLLVPFSGSAAGPGVFTFFNKGGGSWGPGSLTVNSIERKFSGTGWKSAEGDFNNNGNHSIVLGASANPTTGAADVFAVFGGANKTGTAMGGPTYYSVGTGSHPQAAATGFLNSDNLLDFAGVTLADNKLHVFVNNTGAPGTFENCGADVPGMNICSPARNERVKPTFHVSAAVAYIGKSQRNAAFAIFLDGSQIFQKADMSGQLNADVHGHPGAHTLTIQATDNFGHKQTISEPIQIAGPDGGGGGGGCPVPAGPGVMVCSPAQGSTVKSPVIVSASASGGTHHITAMRAYIDGKPVGASSANTITASAPEAAGRHTLTVNAWDSTGKLYQKAVTFSVH